MVTNEAIKWSQHRHKTCFGLSEWIKAEDVELLLGF